MRIKKLSLVIFSLLVCCSVFAQDKIFRTDGSIVDAKIKNVGMKTIVYTRFDNPNGPEYTVLKSEVDKIKYDNGSEELFGDNRTSIGKEEGRMGKNALKGKYKPTVLALAPIQFTENGIAGVSVSYEHAIDNQGIAA